MSLRVKKKDQMRVVNVEESQALQLTPSKARMARAGLRQSDVRLSALSSKCRIDRRTVLKRNLYSLTKGWL